MDLSGKGEDGHDHREPQELLVLSGCDHSEQHPGLDTQCQHAASSRAGLPLPPKKSSSWLSTQGGGDPQELPIQRKGLLGLQGPQEPLGKTQRE